MTAIRRLRPYPNNARTHTPRQISEIARSIQQFGFTNPVLIDERDQIIAGHGRVEAAKLLGWKEVPTLRIDHLSEAQKKAYILADNKLAEKAGWNREILAIELQTLLALEFELEFTGFETPEIDLIFGEAAERSGDSQDEDDEVPEAASGPAISSAGDLWCLGAHRLFCGDAREPASYQALLQDRRADLVITDPPYNVRIERNVSGLGRVRHRNFVMASGEMDTAQFIGFLETAFRLFQSHTTVGALHYIFMDWRHALEILTAGKATFGELKNICVWNKTNAGMGSFYRSKHELVFVWKSGGGRHVNNVELGRFGRARSNVWDYPGVNTLRPDRLDELAMHPTVKPVALVADAIKDASRHRALVLDPFAGSGTTVIAAEKTGREARVMEIDPHYCDVIIRRWQAYSGKAATNAVSGARFGEGSDGVRRTGRKGRRS